MDQRTQKGKEQLSSLRRPGIRDHEMGQFVLESGNQAFFIPTLSIVGEGEVAKWIHTLSREAFDQHP